LPKRRTGPRIAAAVIGVLAVAVAAVIIGVLAVAVAAVILMNGPQPETGAQPEPTVEDTRDGTKLVKGDSPKVEPKGTTVGPMSNSEKMVKTRPPKEPTGARDGPMNRPPVPEGNIPKEETEAFEYATEGETKKGTRRVLKLDLGGGETMEFVRVSKGTFRMGAPAGEKDAEGDEKPQRDVEITKDFYLGKFEVTQSQYKAVTGEAPGYFKGDRLPVEQVSWDDAVKFCGAVAKKTGRRVDLPSEAEWEYACRAGTTTPFHFGSKLNGDLANCDGNHPYGTDVKGTDTNATADVGSYPANPWGLYDLHGNVYEWCRDYYGPYEKVGGLADPIQLTKQSYYSRVLRGGSWSGYAWSCRAAYRNGLAPDNRSRGMGFRISFRLD